MKKNKKFIWITSTYFAEGLPYTIIRSISSVFLRDKNVSLETIGLTSLYGIPWILKFLWGPFIDNFSTKRNFLVSIQFFLSLIFLISALFSPFSTGILLIGIIFFIGSLLAATQDIAIDGYYMEALEKKEQEKYIGLRILAYRMGMIFGTSILITIGTAYSWFLAFLTASIVLFLLSLFHFIYLPKVEQPKENIKELFKKFAKFKFFIIIAIVIVITYFLNYLTESAFYKTIPYLSKLNFSHIIGILLILSLLSVFFLKTYIKNKIINAKDKSYSDSFLSFIDRDKIGLAILFIISIRVGEFLLHAMVPTFLVDLGLKEHYGWISGGVGLPASIAGALLGGFVISKWGYKKTGFYLLLFQNVTNLLYMFAAFYLNNSLTINTNNAHPEFMGNINLIMIASIVGIEQLSAGVGTAVLTSYLLKVCMKNYKTTHFAIATGLMNVSGAIAGIIGGFTTSAFGYGYFFLISFIFAVPSMILFFYAPDYEIKELIKE